MGHASQARIFAHQTSFGTLCVSGPDARSWLNGLVTCDVDQVSQDSGVWGLLLTKRGKVVCDFTLLAGAETLWLGTKFEVGQLSELLDGYLVMEDAELSVQTDCAWLTLHGPGAFDLVRTVSAPSVVHARVPWTQAEAVAVVVSGENVASWLDQLTTRGAELLDADAWTSLRVQAGLPEFGVDFGSDDNPHQAALDRRAVSFTKGCYMGQEVVCMQDMRGKVKRRLAKVHGQAGKPWQAGALVTDELGAEVGRITTADPVGAEERVAIARLKAPNFEPGTQLCVDGVACVVQPLESASPKPG